jgi:hypothetical protein
MISAYWQVFFTVEQAQSVKYFQLGKDDLAGEKATASGRDNLRLALASLIHC